MLVGRIARASVVAAARSLKSAICTKIPRGVGRHVARLSVQRGEAHRRGRGTGHNGGLSRRIAVHAFSRSDRTRALTNAGILRLSRKRPTLQRNQRLTTELQ